MSGGFAKNFSDPGKMITTIILLVIALQVIVQTVPTVIAAIINMSTISNLSFASFFAANGVVLLGLSAAIVLGILAVFGLAKGKR